MSKIEYKINIDDVIMLSMVELHLVLTNNSILKIHIFMMIRNIDISDNQINNNTI